jgi:hypothetical protein
MRDEIYDKNADGVKISRKQRAGNLLSYSRWATQVRREIEGDDRNVIPFQPRRGNGLDNEARTAEGAEGTHKTIAGKAPLKPDKIEAERFLTALDPKATYFAFQTFDDNTERKKEREKRNLERRKAGKHGLNDRYAHIIHGTLDQRWDRLVRLNAEGAGIFVTINKTDRKGREKENVTRVRSLFNDLDGSPLEPVLAINPHIVVESSPRRFHTYCLVADARLEDFAPCQQALAARFNSDPKVNLGR